MITSLTLRGDLWVILPETCGKKTTLEVPRLLPRKKSSDAQVSAGIYMVMSEKYMVDNPFRIYPSKEVAVFAD